jgi:L-lactate permease
MRRRRTAGLNVCGAAIANMICVNNVIAAVMAYLISKGFNPLPLKA